jgi:hypothetical protein
MVWVSIRTDKHLTAKMSMSVSDMADDDQMAMGSMDSMGSMAADVDADIAETTDASLLSLNCLGINLPQIVPTHLSSSEFGTWQTNALLLGLIATFLVEFGGRGKSTNKKNIAIMAAVVAAALECWLLSVYYKSKQTLAWYFMLIGLLVVLAIFIYLAVIAGLS